MNKQTDTEEVRRALRDARRRGDLSGEFPSRSSPQEVKKDTVDGEDAADKRPETSLPRKITVLGTTAVNEMIDVNQHRPAFLFGSKSKAEEQQPPVSSQQPTKLTPTVPEAPIASNRFQEMTKKLPPRVFGDVIASPSLDQGLVTPDNQTAEILEQVSVGQSQTVPPNIWDPPQK